MTQYNNLFAEKYIICMDNLQGISISKRQGNF